MPKIVKHFLTLIGAVPPNVIALNNFTHKTVEVPDWDVDRAVETAGVTFLENNARPYAFYFTTRGRGRNDLDSRELNRSPNYYIGGELHTLEDLEAAVAMTRADGREPDKFALNVIDNMRKTNTEKVIVNDNSWRFVGAFTDADVLLPVTLPPMPLAEAH